MRHFSDEPWPNSLDFAVTAIFLTVAVILPAIGYFFMLCDVRAYLRSLRRQVACISYCVCHFPDWAAACETPRAIAALGLRLPCTEEDLKRAYRKRVKKLHPDHGGDQRRFLILQAQFEEGLALLARQAHTESSPWSAGQHAA